MRKYKSMYLHLFNRVSQAIAILEKAQQEAEMLFLEQDGFQRTDNQSHTSHAQNRLQMIESMRRYLEDLALPEGDHAPD